MSADAHVDFSPLPGICTALTPQKKRPNRISVFVDEHFVCGAEARAVKACGITRQMELGETLIRRLCALDEHYRFEDQCYRWLSRRSHSRRELEQKARQKNYSDSVVSSVLSEFEEKGWIDDQAFAGQFAEFHFNQKKWGPGKIEAALKQKGISDTLIRVSLQPFKEKEVQLPQMITVVQKSRYRLLRETDAQKQKHKLVDLLRRKGYHPDVIFPHIDELTQFLNDETTNI